MEGFSFVTPVTGLNRPNTGKEDDDALGYQHVVSTELRSVSHLIWRQHRNTGCLLALGVGRTSDPLFEDATH
jgi:hypothetical protein